MGGVEVSSFVRLPSRKPDAALSWDGWVDGWFGAATGAVTGSELAVSHSPLSSPPSPLEKVVPPVSKRLACGDVGTGGMAAPADIAAAVRQQVQERPPSA